MIHGLTSQNYLVRGGKVKIGERNERGLPQRLNYFRFVPDDEALLPLWKEAFTEKPQTLPIMLPFGTMEEIFPHEYQIWQGRHLWCHGDNQVAVRKEKATGNITKTECNDQCPFRYLPGEKKDKKRQCKPTGTLCFMLPDLPTMHVFTITTRSIYSILRINSGLKLLQSSLGQLELMHMILSVRMQGVMVEGTSTEVPVLALDVPKSLSVLNVGPMAGLPSGEQKELPETTVAYLREEEEAIEVDVEYEYKEQKKPPTVEEIEKLITLLNTDKQPSVRNALERAKENPGDLLGLAASIETMIEQQTAREAKETTIAENEAPQTATETKTPPKEETPPPDTEQAPVLATDEQIKYVRDFSNFLVTQFGEGAKERIQTILDTIGLASWPQLEEGQFPTAKAALTDQYEKYWRRLCDMVFEKEEAVFSDEGILAARFKYMGDGMQQSEAWNSQDHLKKVKTYYNIIEALPNKKTADVALMFDGEVVPNDTD